MPSTSQPTASGARPRDVSLYNFFAPGGVLAKTHPAYEFRRGQLQMAQAVEEALEQRRHLIVEAGTGTGKTLVCRRFLGQLDDGVNQVYLTNGRFADPTSFLQTILYEVSLPYEGKREQELRLVLTDFLLEQFAGGRRTVLVIDEGNSALQVVNDSQAPVRSVIIGIVDHVEVEHSD